MPASLLKSIRSFVAIGLLLGAFFYGPSASAQTPSGSVSRSTWINTTLASCFPNNTQGQITPTVMRNCLTIFANSVLFSQSALSDLPGGPIATVADANYAASVSNTWISYSSLTTARTVTLPLTTSAGQAQTIAIGDQSGSASMSVPIIVSTQGSDSFGGGITNFEIVSPFSYVEFRNNGSGLWTVHQ